MAPGTARDAKVIQYLNEAYGKEKQLETALEAHIGMTARAPYKRRLQQHLKETKNHARQLERRVKKLGGGVETTSAEAVQNVANRAAALAQGPLHALRGTGEQEKLLKNAKTEYQDEAEEIATYTAIEALAENVGDRDTATLAKKIRREEERMRDFLARLIPQLTRAVAQEEIPASERRTGRGRRRSTGRRTSSSTRRGSSNGRRSRTTSRSRASSSRSSSARSGGRSSSSRSSGSRSAGSRSSGGGTSRSRSTAGRSSRASSSGRRSTRSGSSSGSRSSGSRSSGSRSSGGRSSGGRSSGGRSSGGRSSGGRSSGSGSSRRSSGGR